MLEKITKMAEEVSLKSTTTTPIHFVLVHGISGGGWCWYKIRCLMENSGYKVSTVDLKSAGIDPANADSVLSFDDYNKPLLNFLSSLPEHEQVVLVGHSAGGLSVTLATLKFPKKIRLAVYVAATMLKHGFTSEEDVKDGVPNLSEFGDVYELGFELGADKPPTSGIVKKEVQRKIIYQMSPQEVELTIFPSLMLEEPVDGPLFCDGDIFLVRQDVLIAIWEDSTLAAMLLRPGPLLAITTAQFKEEDDDHDIDALEKVPRVYVKTLQDHVVKPAQQDSMVKRWPPAEVYVLDSDHSPFFSQPFLLFGFLVKAAEASHWEII